MCKSGVCSQLHIVVDDEHLDQIIDKTKKLLKIMDGLKYI